MASLAELCEVSEAQVREAIQQLGARLAASSALQIVQIAGGYQMCTKAVYADLLARYLKPARQRLSRSVMECLAIVAYKQPVTLAELEAIRGVQSDYGLRVLLERRLVKEVGRKPTPGRPHLYGTTQQFLHQFNMNDLGDLPELQLAIGEDQIALPARSSEDLPLPGLD